MYRDVRRPVAAVARARIQGSLPNQQDRFVAEVLPILLEALDKEKLLLQQQKWVQNLSEWDQRVIYDSKEAGFFYVWWRTLRNSIWQDQLWEAGKKILPQRSRTVALLMDVLKSDKPHPWHLEFLDDIRTDKIESLEQLVTESYIKSWLELESRFHESWQWHNINPTQLEHLLRISTFSSGKIMANGSLNTVNANKSSYGAAWKMIVQLGDEFETWTMIPGGISGNPFSQEYEQFVDPWAKGEFIKTHYWKNPQQNQLYEQLVFLEEK